MLQESWVYVRQCFLTTKCGGFSSRSHDNKETPSHSLMLSDMGGHREDHCVMTLRPSTGLIIIDYWVFQDDIALAVRYIS